MTLKQPELSEDDPRREQHATTYQASRGGWYPPTQQPEKEPSPRPAS